MGINMKNFDDGDDGGDGGGGLRPVESSYKLLRNPHTNCSEILIRIVQKSPYNLLP